MRDPMKKLIWVLVAAALILALLLGIPLLSRLIYGRSQQATLFAWQLKKESYLNDYYFTEYLLEKRQQNTAEYELPEDVELTSSLVRQEVAEMPLYILNGAAQSQLMVFYFPGGSYIDQPRGVHWIFLDRLAQELDCTVVVPIYPKLPDSNAETCLAALEETYTQFMTGMVHGEIVFMGDSAGGGLALSFAMWLRDDGIEGPDRLILICPWVDVTLTNDEIPVYEKKDPALDSQQLRGLGELWAGELSPRDPAVSPLFGDFEGLGHITILTGTAELLYPDIMVLDRLLTQQGIDHDTYVAEGMFHVWPLYIGYGIPETEEAFDYILQAAAS